MKPKIIKCSGSSSEFSTQACLAFSLTAFLFHCYKNTGFLFCSLLTLPDQTRASSPVSYIKLPSSLPQGLCISLSSSVFSVLFNVTPIHTNISAFLYLCLPCPPSPTLAIMSSVSNIFTILYSLECSQYTQALCVCVCSTSQ